MISFDYAFKEAQKPLEQRIQYLEQEVKRLSKNHDAPSTDFVSAQEVMKRYTISATTLWRWYNSSNTISKYSFSGKTYYRISQIEKVLENGKC